MKRLVAFGLLGLITTACGTEQSPSFTEKRDSRTIRVTVEDDPEEAGEKSASRESLDEMDVGAVLDAAYDDTAPGGNSDSPAGTSGSAGGASGSSSPSSSDATAATGGGGMIVAATDGAAAADLSDASVTGGSAAGSGATAAATDDGNEGELGLPTSGSTTTGSGDEGGVGSGAGSGSTGTAAGGSSTDGTSGSTTGSTGGGTSGSASGSTGGNTADGSTGIDVPTEGELRACAKLQGVAVDRVKVAGSQNNMSLTSSSVAAIKITGNQNSVSLMLAGAAEARLAGVCIFLAGNQARIDMDVGLNLERLVYVARGNQSHGELALSGNGTIGAMAVDLSGNGASLHISGDGAASICDAAQVRQKGKGTKLLCN